MKTVKKRKEEKGCRKQYGTQYGRQNRNTKMAETGSSKYDDEKVNTSTNNVNKVQKNELCIPMATIWRRHIKMNETTNQNVFNEASNGKSVHLFFKEHTAILQFLLQWFENGKHNHCNMKPLQPMLMN